MYSVQTIAITATKVLNSVSPSYRCKRNRKGFAEQQLRYLDQNSCDFTVKLLAYGVLYADDTGRTIGQVSMALRRATPWQSAQLVAAMVKDGLRLTSEVPAWLNKNAMRILA